MIFLGVGWGDVNIPDTWTHSQCHATHGIEVGWGDVNIRHTCTHGRCWASHGCFITCTSTSEYPTNLAPHIELDVSSVIAMLYVNFVLHPNCCSARRSYIVLHLQGGSGSHKYRCYILVCNACLAHPNYIVFYIFKVISACCTGRFKSSWTVYCINVIFTLSFASRDSRALC